VKIGERHGHEGFFQINTWNYRQSVPNYYPEKGDCNASLSGTSEGALFPQFNTNESVLWYWRKTLCRAVPLYFDSETQIGNLKGYKYILRDDVYDRFENKTADCYKGSDLPDGLSDVSKCFFGENKRW
jgi:CD36 family